MGWRCRAWTRIAKVDERDRIVPTGRFEHQCSRRSGPHDSTFVVAEVQIDREIYEHNVWQWSVRVPYHEVAHGYEDTVRRAQKAADRVMRDVKAGRR